MAKREGADLFAALTNDERHVLAAKLNSGTAMALNGNGDYQTASEISLVGLDVTAPWAPEDWT